MGLRITIIPDIQAFQMMLKTRSSDKATRLCRSRGQARLPRSAKPSTSLRATHIGVRANVRVQLSGQARLQGAKTSTSLRATHKGVRAKRGHSIRRGTVQCCVVLLLTLLGPLHVAGMESTTELQQTNKNVETSVDMPVERTKYTGRISVGDFVEAGKTSFLSNLLYYREGYRGEVMKAAPNKRRWQKQKFRFFVKWKFYCHQGFAGLEKGELYEFKTETKSWISQEHVKYLIKYDSHQGDESHLGKPYNDKPWVELDHSSRRRLSEQLPPFTATVNLFEDSQPDVS